MRVGFAARVCVLRFSITPICGNVVAIGTGIDAARRTNWDLEVDGELERR